MENKVYQEFLFKVLVLLLKINQKLLDLTTRIISSCSFERMQTHAYWHALQYVFTSICGILSNTLTRADSTELSMVGSALLETVF